MSFAVYVVYVGLLKVIRPASKVRHKYVKFINQEMKQELQQLLLAGKSSEEIARTLIFRRNSIKAETRKLMATEILFGNAIVEYLERRNLKKYGNALGPGAEYFKGKSWDEVIRKAFKSNYLTNKFLLHIF